MLAASAVLCWIMLLTASLTRSRGWTPEGMKVGFGNRDDLPEPTPLAGRADRAAKNMLENLLLFTALLMAAHVGGVPSEQLALPSQLFFFARLIYFPVYLAGIEVVRTLLWAVGVVGMAMIAIAVFATQ